MDKKTQIQTIKAKYHSLSALLNERSRRCWAAGEARALGWGGISLVAQITHLDPKTIQAGLREIKSPKPIVPIDRIRQSGGGRKKVIHSDPTIIKDLLSLVSGSTRGDPQSRLQWTNKSTRALSNELVNKKHTISHTKVSQILKTEGYTMQANQKTREGLSHPDRDLQFRHINDTAGAYLKAHNPVISVDTKKKELVGNYKNNGQRWLPKGKPVEVNTHDFPDKTLGKAAPYGVYDIGKDQGYVNVGITHDTSEFAVASIERWWKYLGKKQYPKSRKLLITPDSGGSNGYRLRLWKQELQGFSDRSRLEIEVSHFPPGTSKWNKIEHKLFSFISINWKGRPLTSYAVIVKLIGSTKTKSGLKVYAALDDKTYLTNREVTDEEMEALNITRSAFHGEWNYTIKPKVKK
jgi:hypothetical protein